MNIDTIYKRISQVLARYSDSTDEREKTSGFFALHETGESPKVINQPPTDLLFRAHPAQSASHQPVNFKYEFDFKSIPCHGVP